MPPAIGYDIGLLWGNEATFETGATAFATAHPEVDAGLIEMMRNDRREWQNDLALFRNEHLEHQRPVDHELLGRFCCPDSAATEFDNVWQAIEDIAVQLFVSCLPAGVELVEIPDDERHPVVPRRFGFHVPGLDVAAS